MFRALICLTVALAGVTLLAQAPPPGSAAPPQGQAQATTPPAQQGQVPVFRAGVDVIRLDVSVLDRNRRPVTGLTADDFTVLEDGKPQRIVAVSEVAMAEDGPAPSARMRHVTPDVAANDLTDIAAAGSWRSSWTTGTSRGTTTR